MAEARKAFLEELKVLSKLKNFRRCMLLDSINDIDATLQDYHELNKIFIDPYCYNQLKRLTEAFKMSIKDDWNDGSGFSFQNTGTSYYKHRVFEQEIDFINGLIASNNHKYGFNAFIALLISRHEWDYAFYDTDDYETAQELLDELCYLFDYFMKKPVQEIGYGNDTKKALYKAMKSLNKDIEHFELKYKKLKKYLNKDEDMDAYFKNTNIKKPKTKNINELLKERNELVTYGFIRMIPNVASNSEMNKLILEYTKNRNWKDQELSALTANELKAFCRGYGLPDDGDKIDLMERLADPDFYVFKLKRKHHYTNEWETADDQLARGAQFAEERYTYNFITKEIEERKEYWDELFGVDL